MGLTMRQILLFSGSFEDKVVSKKDDLSQLEKKVMLVYTGKFNSMDGEVEIKDEDIEKLAANHNGFIANLKRLAAGDIPIKHSPPLQLDHSKSATHTVGRLVGDLEVGEHVNTEGKFKALMGTVRVLGKENVEKVLDGRWTHVSIGADLDEHKISELTITPFPAAADASLLSRFSEALTEYEDMDIFKIYKNFEIGLVVVGKQMFWNLFKNEKHITGGKCSGESDGIGKGKSYVDRNNLSKFTIGERNETLSDIKDCASKFKSQISSVDKNSIHITFIDQKEAKDCATLCTKMPGVDKCTVREMPDGFSVDIYLKQGLSKFSKGVSEMSLSEIKEKMAMFEKCKKHLMDEKKMSEEDAEKHLEEAKDEDVKKMSEEHDAKMSKLAQEDEEKKKLSTEEDEKKKTEMSAHRAKLIQLTKTGQNTNAQIKLAQRKVKLSSRLAQLKAQAKIAPSEIKKLDLEDLAKKSDEAIETALSMYEKREPLVSVGLYGTTKALSGAQLSGALKKLSMEQLELQTRLNMPSKREAAIKRLGEVQEEMKQMGEVGAPVPPVEDVSTDKMSEYEMAWGECKKLMDEGNSEGAKEYMMSYMKKVMSGQPVAEMSSDENVEKQLSALAKDIEKLQTGTAEFALMIAPLIGLDIKELV